MGWIIASLSCIDLSFQSFHRLIPSFHSQTTCFPVQYSDGWLVVEWVHGRSVMWFLRGWMLKSLGCPSKLEVWKWNLRIYIAFMIIHKSNGYIFFKMEPWAKLLRWTASSKNIQLLKHFDNTVFDIPNKMDFPKCLTFKGLLILYSRCSKNDKSCTAWQNDKSINTPVRFNNKKHPMYWYQGMVTITNTAGTGVKECGH